jgi:hypothetical protein
VRREANLPQLLSNVHYNASDGYYVTFLLTNEKYTVKSEERGGKPSSSAQRQLLRYYLSAGQAASILYDEDNNDLNLGRPSKPSATKLITRYFKQHEGNQVATTKALRDFLDDASFKLALSGKGFNYPCTPSDLAQVRHPTLCILLVFGRQVAGRDR